MTFNVNDKTITTILTKAREHGWEAPELKESWLDNYGGMVIYSAMYSREFLKAVFGKEWQHHAQQMIISEDPLEYIKKFL